jgi:hypothetical protein
LRAPGPGADAESEVAMADIQATGVTLMYGAEFDGFAQKLGQKPLDRTAA